MVDYYLTDQYGVRIIARQFLKTITTLYPCTDGLYELMTLMSYKSWLMKRVGFNKNGG